MKTYKITNSDFLKAHKILCGNSFHRPFGNDHHELKFTDPISRKNVFNVLKEHGIKCEEII